jgi:tetratricopeptide repeat protein
VIVSGGNTPASDGNMNVLWRILVGMQRSSVWFLDTEHGAAQFFNRVFLAGAAVGAIAYASISPPTPTLNGNGTWLRLLVLAAANGAGFALLLLYLSQVSPLVFLSFRLFGLSAFSHSVRTAKLFRRTRVASDAAWRVVSSLVLLTILIEIGRRVGFGKVVGIACFVVVPLALILGNYYLRPPVVLFLAASSSRALAILNTVRHECGLLLRTVALLDMRLGVTDDHRSFLGEDNFRTRDDALWKEMVSSLKELAPVIVVDTDAATEGVLFEIGNSVRTGTIGKALFLVSDAGAGPALAAAHRAGLVSQDVQVHTVRERDLVPAIWHSIGAFSGLPLHHGLPDIRLTSVGEISDLSNRELETAPAAAIQRQSERAYSLRMQVERYVQDGNHDDAEPALRQGLDLALAMHPASQEAAWYLANLAEVLRLQGKSADSMSFFRQAMALQEQLDGSSSVMASLCNNFGLLMYDQGDTRHAMQLMERASRIATEKLGADDSHTRRFHANLEAMQGAVPGQRLVYVGMGVACLAIVSFGIWLGTLNVYLWLIGGPLAIGGLVGCAVTVNFVHKWFKR